MKNTRNVEQPLIESLTLALSDAAFGALSHALRTNNQALTEEDAHAVGLRITAKVKSLIEDWAAHPEQLFDTVERRAVVAALHFGAAALGFKVQFVNASVKN